MTCVELSSEIPETAACFEDCPCGVFVKLWVSTRFVVRGDPLTFAAPVSAQLSSMVEYSPPNECLHVLYIQNKELWSCKDTKAVKNFLSMLYMCSKYWERVTFVIPVISHYRISSLSRLVHIKNCYMPKHKNVWLPAAYPGGALSSIEIVPRFMRSIPRWTIWPPLYPSLLRRELLRCMSW